MKAKTFAAQYELIEFNHYIDHESEKPIDIVDIIVESDNISFIEKEFNSIFVIDTGNNTYVFSDYELIECYEVGGKLIRVICAK